MLNQIDAINEFNNAMREAGVRSATRVLGTGKVERFRLESDGAGDKSGWAVLFLDEIPAGAFGNWKTGEKHQWCAVDRAGLPRAEAIRVNDLLAQAEVRRAKEAERLARAAAGRAVSMLAEATPAAHPYLTAKQVGGYHTRVLGDELLISIHTADGVITSLQRVSPDGSKRFLPSGRIAGCVHYIGPPEGVTYIVEGWATGATVHALTGRPVVVAFNAGNILPAARAVRAAYPRVRLVLAADNDQWGVRNAGVEAAKALAEMGVPYVLPVFPPVDGKPTDFNDLAAIDRDAAAKILRELPAIPEPEELPVVSSDVPLRFVALPDVKGEKNTPIASIENLAEVLRRLGVEARYNLISKQEELIIPGAAYSSDNRANASLAWVESMCAKYGMPTDKVGQFITHIADANPYNPVSDWIESKPWDGRSRMERFFGTIMIVGEDEGRFHTMYKHAVLRRWMTSAVAAAYRPNGLAGQGVLVLQGAQAMGKTSWFKSLCPGPLRSDGVTLDLRDKDSQINALGFWLVELGELDATFRRSDIAQLKSFITRDRDVIRMAYAKRKSEFSRRTVFFASVNSQNFLRDDTGNRRFWTLECESIDFQHRMDMQQIWAEVLAGYRNGEGWVLTAEESEWVNSVNAAFEEVDPIEDDLRGSFDWEAPHSQWTWMSAKAVLELMNYANPSNSDCKRVSALVKKISQQNSARTKKGRVLRIAPATR